MKIKRMLSLIIVLCMIISVLPSFSMMVSAAEDLSDATTNVTLKDTDGDGFYEISTKDELYAFANLAWDYSGLNGELMNDIDFNPGYVFNSDGTVTYNGEVVTEGWSEWTPIVDEMYSAYSGTFDGQGYAVSGLYTKCSEIDVDKCSGLFGSINDATVKNIGVENSYFCGYFRAGGGIVGKAINSTIENCYFTGTIRGSEYTHIGLGGVVGDMYQFGSGADCTINNCYNTGSVSGGGWVVGGVAGYIGVGEGKITMSNCYNTGNVTGGGYCLGGVAGYIDLGAGYIAVGEEKITMSNCYNTGNVSGEYYTSDTDRFVGGFAGYVSGRESKRDYTVSNCYNTGNVSVYIGVEEESDYTVGGFVGKIDTYNSQGDYTVNNCYNTGDVSVDRYIDGGTYGSCRVGGLVGYIAPYLVKSGDYTVSNCYNTGDISGGYVAGGVVGLVEHGTIINCYNTGDVSGTYDGGVAYAIVSESNVANCYYLDDVADVGIAYGSGSAEAKTKEQFASGEVCYLLNDGVTDGTQDWYQTIGEDDSPVFSGETVCFESGTYYNKNGAVIDILTTDKGVWDSPFFSYLGNYTVYVNEEDVSITLTQTYDGGTVKCNNELLYSGEAKTFALNDKVTVIELQREAGDVVQKTTYTITVIKADEPLIVTDSDGGGIDILLNTNVLPEFEKATIVVATYDSEGALRTTDTVAVSRDEGVVNVPFDSPFAETVKVMLWNSKDDMVPICEPVEITIEE